MWDRVTIGPGGPVVGGRGVPAGEVVGLLESGEPPARVAESLGLEAADLIAALGYIALGEAGADGPPLVQASPRRPRLAGALSEESWAPLLPGAARPARLALAAGLLQVHDFWDASHEAAQEADDLGERSWSAYWHGVGHRREPDSGNASYWFRRVGRHPLFGPLAAAVLPRLEEHGDRALTARLVGGGAWDPFAFIALCADGRPGPGVAGLAVDLQRLEMLALLGATASAVLR